MSNYQLSETELNVLNKGLTFIPTPKKISHTPILEAATRFGRRLKIGYHFRKSKLKLGPEKFTPKSNWEPSDKSIHSDVLNTIKEIHNDLSNLKVPAHKENLSKSEATVLKKIKQNPEIILKPADKGSATVILDRENYVAEGNRQLNNPNHYIRLDQPIFQTTSKKIDSILQDLHNHNFISAKQLLYLRPSPDSRPRRMYMLPKIHKSLDKWPFPNKMPPGRPIISDCSSESYAVSEYIDHFLQDISRTHASYVKDSSDFISKLGNVKTKPDTLLITLDVESMYTNIDNERGLAAVKNAFLANPDPRRSDPHVLELLELSLKYNDFEFNGDTFLQISGTAMGKKFAPSYANIFMAEWETTALAKCYLKPSMFLHYLDDIWILWDHGRDQFETFFDILNTHSPAVKLTSRIEQNSIDFLDITIYKGARTKETGLLDTKVFFKPTDTHQLLHKSSFHPKHTFAGILKSQIIRFYRICSERQEFDHACSVLFNALRARGYSKRFLRSIKSQTLQQLETGKSLNHPFEYNPNVDNISTAPCGFSPLCFTCDSIMPRSEIVSRETKQTFRIQTEMKCNSSNIIYMIECASCGIQYIGQTKRSLRHRFNNHRQDILHERNTSVSLHFNQLQCEPNDCKITPIFQCPKLASDELTTRKRLEIEQYFIGLLKTYSPFGLNIAQRKYKDSPTIQFIVPYSGLASKASQIVRKHYIDLQQRMPNVYPDVMITAFKRNKNLSDMLVSSQIKPIET